ncbi:hypothetical protein [Bifidobacterium aquikefiri]|uniref:hypothetical protein n=1 Tax=Bifidobacterium aquikefiri TaxID=1653207 RepID=UPI0039E8F237
MAHSDGQVSVFSARLKVIIGSIKPDPKGALDKELQLANDVFDAIIPQQHLLIDQEGTADVKARLAAVIRLHEYYSFLRYDVLRSFQTIHEHAASSFTNNEERQQTAQAISRHLTRVVEFYSQLKDATDASNARWINFIHTPASLAPYTDFELDDICLSEQANKLIEDAKKRAEKMGSATCDTSHMLISLLNPTTFMFHKVESKGMQYQRRHQDAVEFFSEQNVNKSINSDDPIYLAYETTQLCNAASKYMREHKLGEVTPELLWTTLGNTPTCRAAEFLKSDRYLHRIQEEPVPQSTQPIRISTLEEFKRIRSNLARSEDTQDLAKARIIHNKYRKAHAALLAVLG